MSNLDADMIDVDPINQPILFKGKGKANQADVNKDNLPWCVLPKRMLILFHSKLSGWRSIDPSH
jgi:hypothetical protein